MRGKMIVLAVLTACAAGAYWQIRAGPALLRALMDPPEPPRFSFVGMKDVIATQPPHAYRHDGSVTVLVFYTDGSEECRLLRDDLRRFLAFRPDVAVRMALMEEGWNGRAYMARNGIDFAVVPHVIVYNADGSVLAADNGPRKEGLDLLNKWMLAERRRAERDGV